MIASILSGQKRPGKGIKVHNLKPQSAKRIATIRGKKTNHNQIDGRRWRRDHPATPHEHDLPKTKR